MAGKPFAAAAAISNAVEIGALHKFIRIQRRIVDDRHLDAFDAFPVTVHAPDMERERDV